MGRLRYGESLIDKLLLKGESLYPPLPPTMLLRNSGIKKPRQKQAPLRGNVRPPITKKQKKVSSQNEQSTGKSACIRAAINALSPIKEKKKRGSGQNEQPTSKSAASNAASPIKEKQKRVSSQCEQPTCKSTSNVLSPIKGKQKSLSSQNEHSTLKSTASNVLSPVKEKQKTVSSQNEHPTCKSKEINILSPIEKKQKSISSQSEQPTCKSTACNVLSPINGKQKRDNGQNEQPTCRSIESNVPSPIEKKQKSMSRRSESLWKNESDSVLVDIDESGLVSRLRRFPNMKLKNKFSMTLSQQHASEVYSLRKALSPRGSPRFVSRRPRCQPDAGKQLSFPSSPSRCPQDARSKHADLYALLRSCQCSNQACLPRQAVAQICSLGANPVQPSSNILMTRGRLIKWE